MHLNVSVVIDAPPPRVWAAIEDVRTHPRWMRDATEVRVTSATRVGTGATFDCDTRVGPFRLTDRMEVVEWRPPRAMGIRHTGVVTGTGRFSLRRTALGRTRFTWEERLSFPWRVGGAVTALLARPVLAAVWRGNLRLLKRLVETGELDG